MMANPSALAAWVLCLALAACAGSRASELPPLSKRVDAGTLASLVTLAARDHICFQLAAGELFAFDEYRHCMNARLQLSACEVSGDDLQQLRALMLADRRLAAVAPLESVIAQLASACSGGLDPRVHAEEQEQPRLPELCTPRTPLLIAHAVPFRLRTPPGDARTLEQRECDSVFGKRYLSDHCWQWARPLGRSFAELQAQRPKYLEYFCPLKDQW